MRSSTAACRALIRTSVTRCCQHPLVRLSIGGHSDFSGVYPWRHRRCASGPPRGHAMFASLGLLLVFGILLITLYQQRRDGDDGQVNMKFARQELRLIAFLLFAVIVMLGVIADRLP